MSIRSQKQGLVKGSSLVAAAIMLCLTFITVAHSQSQSESPAAPLIAAVSYDGGEKAPSKSADIATPADDARTDDASLTAANEVDADVPQTSADAGQADLAELLMAAAADAQTATSADAAKDAQSDVTEFLAQKASMLENMIKLMQIKEELLANRIAFDRELARMEMKTRR